MSSLSWVCELLVNRSYTALIAPVASARLYSEARAQSCLPLNTNEGPASPPVGMQRALETPYVVRSHAASQTHREQECWTFCHPHPASKGGASSGGDDAMDTSEKVVVTEEAFNRSARAAESINNDRCAHLSFSHDPTGGAGVGCGYGAVDAEMESVAVSTEPAAAAAGAPLSTDGNDGTVTIHGFLGSFHSVLYESTKGENKGRSSVISISPKTFSVGMFSWFPLYFPLKEPLRVPPGATVNCSVWRRSDVGRVWYEWCAEVVTANGDSDEPCVWATSSIHNPGGRSYHVKK